MYISFILYIIQERDLVLGIHKIATTLINIFYYYTCETVFYIRYRDL